MLWAAGVGEAAPESKAFFVEPYVNAPALSIPQGDAVDHGGAPTMAETRPSTRLPTFLVQPPHLQNPCLPPVSAMPQEDAVDDGGAPVMAETGPLSNVVMRGGRAVGTLGHEEEMRKLRRQLIPKKVRGPTLSVLWATA